MGKVQTTRTAERVAYITKDTENVIKSENRKKRRLEALIIKNAPPDNSEQRNRSKRMFRK